MGSTDPLTGARFPVGSDAATIAQYIQNAVNDLSDDTIPPFASAAARDAAYNAWVTQGHTMRDGLHCVVAGIDQVYRGGAWHGIGYSPVLTGTVVGPWTSPVSDSNPRTVSQINVPDPGFPYRLRTYGGVEITADAGTRVDTIMDITGTRWDFVAGYNVHHKHADISPVFTGARTLNLIAYRVSGTGGWTNTTANLWLTAEVVPA